MKKGAKTLTKDVLKRYRKEVNGDVGELSSFIQRYYGTERHGHILIILNLNNFEFTVSTNLYYK